MKILENVENLIWIYRKCYVARMGIYEDSVNFENFGSKMGIYKFIYTHYPLYGCLEHGPIFSAPPGPAPILDNIQYYR